MGEQREISPELLQHVVEELGLSDFGATISVEHLTRLVTAVQEWADKVIGRDVTIIPPNEECAAIMQQAAVEELKRKLSYAVLDEGYVMCAMPTVTLELCTTWGDWPSIHINMTVPVRKA